MSSITAGTSSGTALVQSGDTTGALVIKTGGSAATAATFNADQTVTLAAPLPVASGGTGSTTLSGITTGTATNLAGGANGSIPYQSASGTTQMLAAGTAGQLLQTNGAGAPTWVTPAPSAGSVTAVASGSISANAPVVVNSAGTVSQATGAISGQTNITASEFTGPIPDISNNTYYSCYCVGQNAVLVTFRNSGNSYWTAVAGSISSGGAITWGTAVVLVSSYYDNQNAVWDSTGGCAVVFARQAGNNNFYQVLTVSGNAITVVTGNTVSPGSIGNNWMYAAYSSSANRVFLAAYVDASNGKLVGLQKSGNTYILAGTVSTPFPCYGIAAGSSDGVVIGYTSNVLAAAFTYSGSAFTLGSSVTLQTSYNPNCMSIAYNSADNNYVTTYQTYISSTGNIRANALTVSGTTITAGTQLLFSYSSGSYSTYNSVAYNPTNNAYFCLYDNPTAPNLGQVTGLQVSGTTITTAYTATSLTPNYPVWLRLLYDSSTTNMLMTYKNGATDYLRASEFYSTFSGNASQPLLGFSSASYTDGQTATIQTVGSTSTQIGLTAGSRYYLSQTGVLGTSSTSNYAGIALSSTNLVIKG